MKEDFKIVIRSEAVLRNPHPWLLIDIIFFRIQDRHRLAVAFEFLAILKNGAEFSRARNASRRARNAERRAEAPRQV